MNDPAANANLGEDYVLDEKERERELSNEQIQEIEQRLAAQEEQQVEAVEQVQPATAAQPAPMQPEPQPTGEDTQEPGFLQGLSYFGQPLGETNQQVKERLSAPGQGIIDTATNALNMLLNARAINICFQYIIGLLNISKSLVILRGLLSTEN